MSTKVEQASSHTQATIMSTSSTAATAATGSKVSKFATKSGFVIPKNKLSGSLVPIFRGGKKGGNDTENEEGTKQVQRKTKWGPDLTLDTAVRKGRALAYQTRVDQITQLLSLGTLETRDNQDPSSASQVQDHESSNYVLNTEESECLELERREAISEILKLKPSYKAPPDYKPLLKEAKVSIPIKEYPGYNFIGLLFGPGNDTQKRLAKETGAIIRVYGTKVVTGEKAEVTASDGHETAVAFEELHVHVSADTYEKVDAAVALIELLVTPVSVNPAAVSTTSTKVSADNMNIVALSQGTPTALLSQGVTQQNNLQQYAGPWFLSGATQAPMFPSLGFTTPANPLASLVSNQVQVSSSSLNPSNMPSIFGPRPVETNPQNPSLVPSGPQPPQFLQHPYMPQPHPRNLSMPVSQPTPSRPIFTPTPHLTANQPMPSVLSPIIRPGLSSFPQSAPQLLFSDQSLPSARGSAGWSQPLLSNPSSLGSGNMVSVPPAMTVPQGHLPMAQPIAVSGAPPQSLSPLSRPSASQFAGGAAINQSLVAPPFNSVSHSQMGLHPSLLPSSALGPAPPLVQSSTIVPVQPSMPHMSMPSSSPNLVPGSGPVLSPMASTLRPPPPQSGDPGSAPGSILRFDHNTPPILTAIRPQQPSSSDFTFQPHRPQNPAPQMAHGPSGQAILTNPNLSLQPPQGSQNPFPRPAMHNLNLHSPIFQGFSRPLVGNQMSLPRAQTPMNVAGEPTPHPGAVRHATFPNNSAVPPSAVSLLQPRNFISSPQIGPSAGLPISRAGGPMQFQHSYSPVVTRPRGLIAPNHQFTSNIPFQPAGRPASSSSGVQQIYDPFSPTSASLNSQLTANRANVEKQENDPEYEDLMASVGVK